MKTLIAFALVCSGLLLLAVWSFRREDKAEAPPAPAVSDSVRGASVAPPPEIPSAAKPTDSPGSSGSARPASASRPAEPGPSLAPDTVAHSEVRWVDDEGQRRATDRLAALRALLATDPHNEGALEEAAALARQLERYGEACDWLARLVRLRAEDSALRFELATLLMRRGRSLEALPHLRLVARQDPGSARAWYNLAVTCQTLGRLHDARASWDRVVELTPGNTDALAHRGEVCLDLRDWPTAAEDFGHILQLEPDSVDAALNLSLALDRQAKLAEAREVLLPLLERHADHVPLLNRLAENAWAQFEADPRANPEMAREAVRHCVESLAIDPDQPEIEALRARAARAPG